MIDFFSLPEERRKRVIKMFNERIKKTKGDGCWIWTGKIHKDGYGQLFVSNEIQGKQVNPFSAMAHRFSWMLHYNCNIPAGLYCLHSCDTPACVRPTHIALGTQKQNMAESALKDRQSKVKMITRLKIAELVYKGMTTYAVAKMYNVGRTTVQLYLKRPETVAMYGKIDLNYRRGKYNVTSFPSLI